MVSSPGETENRLRIRTIYMQLLGKRRTRETLDRLGSPHPGETNKPNTPCPRCGAPVILHDLHVTKVFAVKARGFLSVGNIKTDGGTASSFLAMSR